MRREAGQVRRDPHPQVGLLENVQQAGHRPALDELALEADQVNGLGQRRQRRDHDLAAQRDRDRRVLRQPAIEHVQPGRHGVLEPGDKHVGLARLAELGVVGLAFGVEVLGQVLVRGCGSGRPDHPDLLAAQPLAQLLQHADLVVDAVDALVALGVGLHHQLLNGRRHDAAQRHLLPSRVQALGAASVPLEQLEGLDERSVGGVVRAELEGFQQSGHHAPVLGGVRGAQVGVDLEAVGGPTGLVLAHQVTQLLFAAGGREDHLTHAVIGSLDRGFGNAE
jgi:hypothetical protein